MMMIKADFTEWAVYELNDSIAKLKKQSKKLDVDSLRERIKDLDEEAKGYIKDLESIDTQNMD